MSRTVPVTGKTLPILLLTSVWDATVNDMAICWIVRSFLFSSLKIGPVYLQMEQRGFFATSEKIQILT